MKILKEYGVIKVDTKAIEKYNSFRYPRINYEALDANVDIDIIGGLIMLNETLQDPETSASVKIQAFRTIIELKKLTQEAVRHLESLKIPENILEDDLVPLKFAHG
jgi:hypothetical protein